GGVRGGEGSADTAGAGGPAWSGVAATAPAAGRAAAADAVTAAPGGPGAPQAATITVDGGYHPDRVLARAGAPLRLEFDRREEGACSQHVVFPALGVEADLAAHQRTVVDLPALAGGLYEVACRIGMLRGSIEVIGSGPGAELAWVTAEPAAGEPGHRAAPGGGGRPAGRRPGPAPVVVPPVVPDSSARPEPAPGEDTEAAERRAEIAD